jgi:hypothetical protein
MREIQTMMNRYNEVTGNIIASFAQPFIVVRPPPPTLKISPLNPAEQLRQKVAEIQSQHLKELKAITERLQDFTGGTLEYAEEAAG